MRCNREEDRQLELTKDRQVGMHAHTHEDFENGKSRKNLWVKRAEVHKRMHVLFYELFLTALKLGRRHSFESAHALQFSEKSQHTLDCLAT